MLPWYMVDNDVISMCSAHVQRSVWLGVIGKVIVGDSLRREFGRLPVPYHVLRRVLGFVLWVGLRVIIRRSSNIYCCQL